MGSKKSADTRSNAPNPSSSCHSAGQAGATPGAHIPRTRGTPEEARRGAPAIWLSPPHQGDARGSAQGRASDLAQSAFTSLTSRVRDDLASPKSIEVLGA
jgi:hypothetical protein